MTPIPPGLETLDFRFAGTAAVPPFAPVLVGVVGSGNLEVMLEPETGGDCAVRVQTSARGFAPIWRAVLDDFHRRHGLAGVRVSINDMGATPAVVSLRLDQAVQELRP
ncbi:malonate decarboxylase acyl carrier protein [Mitsuaria sp. GD03876]|uniref:malonate decarboxylase acyl carrier protein n=1 Tax=Mitsuaria sp. GD03876 TaxID=2975399 RepID=UPI0024476E07|nr:malonate decarboxylase acyl carrier protein [Mitsuaria sp. GD03876]MDH0867325.1 malonate decarboxylase acyl carrier protein [Mitsuaria sp. GD03876]